MNETGGYFGLELNKGGNFYHHTPHAFSCGRSSLHFILTIIQPSLVYIPFYTCNALLDSFEAAGKKFEFYKVNEALEPADLPELREGEYFLYINYFDTRRSIVEVLSERFGDKLIVDCSQAFFMKGNGKSWFFNSCRKFFGVPDGSFLYTPDTCAVTPIQKKNEKFGISHLLERFNGNTRQGYASFLENEALLGTEICGMSQLTEFLLSNINYADVIEKRKSNYDFLHSRFEKVNLLNIEEKSGAAMYYPLLLPKKMERELLYANNIFIPMFWKDVLTRKNDGFITEKKIATNLYPLPIDHRYNVEDLTHMIDIIEKIQ